MQRFCQIHSIFQNRQWSSSCKWNRNSSLYDISCSFFVAAISTNMIFAKLPSGRHPESRWAWLKSWAEINGIIAVLAGILVYGGVQLIGLTVNHEMRIFILIILTSLVFMSMVTTLATWNSRIGAFFSLILLLLQLASSAGTYSLALTNDFFRSINPWLPMSYSVSGLRQTISINKSFSSCHTSSIYWFRYASLST